MQNHFLNEIQGLLIFVQHQLIKKKERSVFLFFIILFWIKKNG